MGVFDFDRFNGFVRSGLDNLPAAYFYIREYVAKNKRQSIYVRCEPQLAGMKPDIVINDRAKPIYAIEFKYFTKPDYINKEAMYKDLDKLREIMNGFDSTRWGFFYLVHDSEETYTFSDAMLRRLGYGKISVTTINLRRKEDTGRRRNGYDEWREEFDKLLASHREHA